MKRQTFGMYSALEDGQQGTGFNFKLALCLLLVLCLALPFSTRKAVAQSAFGSITGTVTDSQGAVIPGATVTVSDESTGVSQSTQTNNSGEFVFPSLLPATYTVTAGKVGFKKLEKTGLALVAAQRLSAGTFQLAVGQATITVTVNAEGEAVETGSSEVSSTLTTSEIAQLPTMNHDYMAFMQVLPGSNYIGWGQPPSANMGATSPVTFNGMTGEGTGNGTYVSTNGVYASQAELSYDWDPPDIDNIESIHVLASNYEAQYGRTAGTVVNVTTKSGTSHFHGGLYYYLRNEDLNANDYFSVRTDQPRPHYRYNTLGGTLGGPVLIPGWSESRKKLFFFAAFSYEPNTTPAGPRFYLMPTALERQGNFSQSYIPGTTTLYTVLDPLTGQPFPGNIVPKSRFNPAMAAIFNNLFPTPNYFNTAVSQNNYNYIINDSNSTPDDRESLRLDYAATSKMRIFGRWQRASNSNSGRTEPGLLCGWQKGTESYINTLERYEVGSTYMITPRLFNQVSAGWNRDMERLVAPESEVSQFQASTLGVSFANPYPSENPLDLIPGMFFSNGLSFSYEPRFPLNDSYHGWSISDDLTYVANNHQLKFGAYVDSATSYQPHHSGQWGNAGSGMFYFNAPNPSNPYNTGNPLAEALLGYFDSYTYATTKINMSFIQRDFEWYAQDNWKVTKKLSLNYGLRFTADIPVKVGNQYASQIDFSQYNPADAPPLFQPVMVDGVRMMQNPVTGQLEPAAYEDYFVPGVGNPAPGAVSVGNKPLADSKGVLVAPRFGFAYDPFGNGKTVIRGGFSKSYAPRTQWGHVYGNITNAPTVFYPTQYYGEIGAVGTQQGLLGPSVEQYMDPHGDLPYSLQWSFGVQHELGFKTVAGLSYVGNVTRHGEYSFNLNEVPYGAEFLPQHQDPTAGTPLPDDYYRPYPGYNAITYVGFGTNGNNHSLQATLERRFAHNLTYAVAYTWSKLLDDNKGPTYIPVSMTYGSVIGLSRPNRFTADWVWELPKGSRYWDNWLSRSLLNHWSFSGIASFITGAADRAYCSTTTGLNITGGGDGSQCIINGNAVLPKSERTFYRYFNTSVFSLPTPIPPGQTSWTTANVGNQWNTSFYDPGVNNWDLSVMKDIPIKEGVAFQLRGDFFNAFNHPSFNAVNNGAVFDPTQPGNPQVSNTFGQLTSDMSPRIVQVSLRFNF